MTISFDSYGVGVIDLKAFSGESVWVGFMTVLAVFKQSRLKGGIVQNF
jgi:hypothetical protein